MKIREAFLAAYLATFGWAQGWLDSGTPRQVYIRHKAAHAIIGLTLTYLSHEAGDYRAGLICALILAILKEDMDRRAGGSFRVGDIAWTVGPAFVVSYAFKW